ncbi:pantoate--beta-alanine ligase [Thermodesulfobacteriota bacterium]
MEVIQTVKEMQARADRMRRQGKTIAFVPTMGFFHEGHLSLMRIARKKGDDLAVSIYVNPTQFGPGEDLDAYPRDLDRDLALAEKENVDAVFTPENAELYTEEFQTYVTLEKLPNYLCGLSRPVHFRGVATVVTKLFNIVKPHIAVFGQKDYQQLAIIRQMVRDLDFDIEIIGGPIIRESDGLAMSSRNSYLSPDQRASALSLYTSLIKAQSLVKNGIKDAAKIIEETSMLIKSHSETKIDYIAICNPETLVDIQTIDGPALMALAVKIGKTRLIDNLMLNAG